MTENTKSVSISSFKVDKTKPICDENGIAKSNVLRDVFSVVPYQEMATFACAYCFNVTDIEMDFDPQPRRCPGCLLVHCSDDCYESWRKEFEEDHKKTCDFAKTTRDIIYKELAPTGQEKDALLQQAKDENQRPPKSSFIDHRLWLATSIELVRLFDIVNEKSFLKLIKEFVEYAKEFLKMVEEKQGKESASYAVAFGNIGFCLFHAGDIEGAVPMIQESEKLYKPHIPTKSSRTMAFLKMNIAYGLGELGRCEEALKAYDEAYPLFVDTFGDVSDEMAAFYESKSRSYSNASPPRTKESLKTLEKVIEIRKQLPIETKTAQAYVMYGNESVQDMSLDPAARFTITVTAFEKAVELYKSLPTDHKWDIVQCHVAMIDYFPCIGRQDEIEQLIIESNKILKEINDTNSKMLIAENLSRQASLYEKTDPSTALTLAYQSIVEMSNVAPVSEGMERALQRFATMAYSFEQYEAAEGTFRNMFALGDELHAFTKPPSYLENRVTFASILAHLRKDKELIEVMDEIVEASKKQDKNSASVPLSQAYLTYAENLIVICQPKRALEYLARSLAEEQKKQEPSKDVMTLIQRYGAIALQNVKQAEEEAKLSKSSHEQSDEDNDGGGAGNAAWNAARNRRGGRRGGQ